MSQHSKHPKISADEFQVFLKVLQNLGQDPTYLAGASPEDRIQLMKAAGKLAHPTAEENRKIARAARRLRKEKKRAADREARNNTGIREARQSPVFTAPRQLVEIPALPKSHKELKNPRSCYVCKALYTKVHSFYDSMCPECGDLNYRKRFQSCSLEGRTAMVTGGRVKIGYQTALKLLRAGARTIVSTRFPHDSAQRFSREEDFSEWKDRLVIYGLDLRHSPSVEMFARYIANTEKRLDILVNNAAQTVRKPPGFYKHLMDIESTPVQDLSKELRPLLAGYEKLNRTLESKHVASADQSIENTLLKSWPAKSAAIGIHASARLSMIPYNLS